MVKILMSRSIVGDYPSLAQKRRDRYNFRARYAEGLNLNFRCEGYPVAAHGVRKYLANHRYPVGARGICAVCAKKAPHCTCKTIVRDASGAVIREI